MILKECLLIKNSCYLAGDYMTGGKPTGIVVHDTAAGNPWLKRYVQPVREQLYYKKVIDDLGVNENGNHWNNPTSVTGRQACVHAFIGKNKKGEIETYKTLPFDMCCWGVAKGKRGSYNFNPTARIQFEICDDGYKSKDYFYAVMKEAQEFCASLCKLYGFGVDKITDHQGAFLAGYGGNHNDIRIWCKTFGINDAVGWFRAEVQKILDNESEDSPMTVDEKKAFEALQKKVDEQEKQLKVYHFWSEIEKELPWAYAPLMALYKKRLFAGSSPSDLNVCYLHIRILVNLAASLKLQGVIDY